MTNSIKTTLISIILPVHAFFGQVDTTLEIPKTQFKFKHFYLSVVDMQSDLIRYHYTSAQKGKFQVNPEAKEIVYYGDSILPIAYEGAHYTIIHTMEDGMTHSFIVESESLPYQANMIFWKDKKMFAIMLPDDTYMLVTDPKMMEVPE